MKVALALAFALFAGSALAQGTPVYVAGPNPLTVTIGGSGLVYPSPSGQSSNGINITVATVVSNCAQLKGASGNLFSFSFATTNPSGNFVWLIDTALTSVTGTLPQGSGSTTALKLHEPWPMPTTGVFDFAIVGYPYVATAGMLVCISNSATTIAAPSGTVSATGQRL